MGRSLVCLSHLRWDFVYQRPNHLMARAAKRYDVLFVEEPVPDEGRPWLELIPVDGLTVVRPHLPADLAAPPVVAALLRNLLEEREIVDPVLWYYTPMALHWTEGIRASAVVYDCMDELSAFRSAPPALVALEQALLERADLVFTGGRSLFEAKRHRSSAVHCFPSSVDRAHFGQARVPQPDPADQAGIPHPRIGYFGVIDERVDLELVGEVARRRPDWQVVLVGPIAKINPADIPALPNVHHLGRKDYADLPAYLAGWEVALMPFAHNSATRRISPTKTLEYLAAGLPVVSTSVPDVVADYSHVVRIADDPDAFASACTDALGDAHDSAYHEMCRPLLEWNDWNRIAARIEQILSRRPMTARVDMDATA